MPTVQSPGGPLAVRSPSFTMAGYVIFSLREVNRTQFTLNKVMLNIYYVMKFKYLNKVYY